MKKAILALFAVSVLLVSAAFILADKPTSFDSQGNEVGWSNSNSGCSTIQEGNITDSSNTPLERGFDQFGYNYQAHLFVGTYDSSDRVLDGKYWGDEAYYVDDQLIMKWSDAWLANVDCNHDGKLDRGLVNGDASGTSMGWLTNEVNGDYSSNGDEVQDAHYTEFVKIVWVGPGGNLWGQYKIIQDVYNDPTSGDHGLLTKVGAPGFGLNDQWTTTA